MHVQSVQKYCFSLSNIKNARAKILFFVVKYKKCTCKACKNTVFHCQIFKFVGFLLPSSSWLLKLPNEGFSASFGRWNTKIWCQTSCQESNLHRKKDYYFCNLLRWKFNSSQLVWYQIFMNLYANMMVLESLSNHDDDGNKNPANLHICIGNHMISSAIWNK